MEEYNASEIAVCFNLDIVIVPLVPTGIATPTGLRTGICIVCRFFIRSLKEDLDGMALWTLGHPVGILRFLRLWRQVLIEQCLVPARKSRTVRLVWQCPSGDKHHRAPCPHRPRRK